MRRQVGIERNISIDRAHRVNGKRNKENAYITRN